MNSLNIEMLNNTIEQFGMDKCRACYMSFTEGNGHSFIGELYSIPSQQAEEAVNAYEAIASFKSIADAYCWDRFYLGSEECGLNTDVIILNEISINAHPCDYVTNDAANSDLIDMHPEINFGKKYGFTDEFHSQTECAI